MSLNEQIPLRSRLARNTALQILCSFGSRVLIDVQTGKKSRTSDLFWFRAQVNF